MWTVPVNDNSKKNLEEKKITDLLTRLDNEIQNKNEIEKIKAI